MVGAVLMLAVHAQLDSYGGNVTGFAQFGSSFAGFTHPPAGAVILGGGAQYGYDGQFYYVLARDPLLLHASATLGDLAGQVFRAGRVAYPALAASVSRVSGLTLALSMLVVNVAIVLALTAGFAIYARSRGWSTAWAVVLGLLPGMLLAPLRDLTDPLATACVVAGLIAWTRGHRWLAAAFLAVAVLAREVMVLAVVAVAVEAAARAWRTRAVSGSARAIVRECWPAVVIPAVAFLGWQAYVAVRYGGPVPGTSATFPFATFVDALRDAIHSKPHRLAGWDVAYQLLVIAAVVVAVLSLRRDLSALSFAAALLALSLSVAGYEPVWGDTRDSLPVFALLLVSGLEHRRGVNLWICGAAAGMTALIPLAIPGVFPS